VADLVAHLRALGRQFTAPRHLQNPLPSPALPKSALRAARGFKITSIEGSGGRIGGKRRGVKVLGVKSRFKAGSMGVPWPSAIIKTAYSPPTSSLRPFRPQITRICLKATPIRCLANIFA
jgi:hypothetical protein